MKEWSKAKPYREARNGTDGETYFFAKRKNKPPDVSTWRTVMAKPAECMNEWSVTNAQKKIKMLK